MIETVDQLKQYFVDAYRNSTGRERIFVYVPSKIRREWLLTQASIVIEGNVRSVAFLPLGGGVWRAVLEI